MAETQFVTTGQSSLIATHKVLRNTYMLLSMTLLFSAAMAGVAMATGANFGWIPLIIAFGLIFAISKMKNSAWGIVLVFAFTGILGFSLAPMLQAVGSETVITAAALTGMVFLSLSGYVLMTKKDFSYMSGFLMTGMVVVIGAMILSFFTNIPGLQLAISAAVVLLMSGFILFDTSRIINGGETNYVMATVSLYLDIYNLFVHLMILLGVMGGDDKDHENTKSPGMNQGFFLLC